MKKLLILGSWMCCFVSYGQSDTLYVNDLRTAADLIFGRLDPNLYEHHLIERMSGEIGSVIEQTNGNYNQVHDAYSFIGTYSEIALAYDDSTVMLNNEQLVHLIDTTFYQYQKELTQDILVQPFGLTVHNLKRIDSNYYNSDYFEVVENQLVPKIDESELYQDTRIQSAALLEFYGDNGYDEGIIRYDPAFISLSSDIDSLSIRLNTGNGFNNFGPSNKTISYDRTSDSVVGKAALFYLESGQPVYDTISFYLTKIGNGTAPKSNDGWDNYNAAFYDYYQGAHGIDLQIGIKYGCGNNEKIRRPVIIAPPYRPTIQYFSLQKYYEQFDFKSLISSLSDMGYDVLFIREMPGNGSIEEAGATLADFLLEINTLKKQNYPDEDWENVVIGFSAGGQHWRYALKYLEKHHMDWGTPHHHSRLYISFDSPQWGANIPMFTQTVYQDKKGSNIFAALANVSLIDEGSKDMAITHFIGSNVSAVSGSNVYYIHPAPSTERNNLMNALSNDFNHMYSSVNDLRRTFPAFTRNVAVSTGRNDRNYTNEFDLDAGKLLFSQNATVPILGAIVHKNRKLYASQYATETTVFRNLEKRSFFIPYPLFVLKDRDYRTVNAFEWDMAQGGYKDEFLDGLGFYVWPIGAVPILRTGALGLGQKYYNNHMSFLPTVSALGINPGLWQGNQVFYNLKEEDLMYNEFGYNPAFDKSNLYGYPNLGRPTDHFNITPFEAIYCDLQTYEHIKMQESVDADELDDTYLVHTRNFILDEIEADDSYLQNQVIGENHVNWIPGYTYRAWYRAYRSITIGNTVTPKTDPGDYVIQQSGDITVHAGHEVHIMPGFHAAAGSDFHAYIGYDCTRPRGSELATPEKTEKSTDQRFTPFPGSNEHLSGEEKQQLVVFPNPASGNFTVRVPEEFIGGTLTIYDLYGKVMHTQIIERTDSELEKDLPQGMYLVRILKDGQTRTTKMTRL